MYYQLITSIMWVFLTSLFCVAAIPVNIFVLSLETKPNHIALNQTAPINHQTFHKCVTIFDQNNTPFKHLDSENDDCLWDLMVTFIFYKNVSNSFIPLYQIIFLKSALIRGQIEF